MCYFRLRKSTIFAKISLLPFPFQSSFYSSFFSRLLLLSSSFFFSSNFSFFVSFLLLLLQLPRPQLLLLHICLPFFPLSPLFIAHVFSLFPLQFEIFQFVPSIIIAIILICCKLLFIFLFRTVHGVKLYVYYNINAICAKYTLFSNYR